MTPQRASGISTPTNDCTFSLCRILWSYWQPREASVRSLILFNSGELLVMVAKRLLDSGYLLFKLCCSYSASEMRQMPRCAFASQGCPLYTRGIALQVPQLASKSRCVCSKLPFGPMTTILKQSNDSIEGPCFMTPSQPSPERSRGRASIAEYFARPLR